MEKRIITISREFGSGGRFIGEEVAKKLVEFMEEGAKPFCKRLHLGADVDINDHWVH